MARHREPLPRLNLNPALNMPQPGINFGPGQPMFSPALPTSGFHPHFPMNNSMQTPMQPFFNPQPPPAPGRPTHHQGRASIAHLAAAGIHPPNGFPITPMGGHFPRASMIGLPGQPAGPPFPNRNRRQLSIGGPPKAVLGGPARKLSPLPPAALNTPSPAPQKVKKMNVNLPKETVLGEDGQPATRPSWARTTLDGFVFVDQEIPPVELTSGESYPPDEWRNHVPNTLDVFLPGKGAWQEMKQKAIEEKLEKLGVERGSGSNVPHIHAPHARAASISSPADPQVLLYKLNKLQQSQDAAGSAINSLAPSPVPPFGMLSSSPHRSSPGFVTNRHGHTMSLAPLPPQPFFGSAQGSFDPFGQDIESEVEPIPHSGPSALQDSIHAPQGRVPVMMSSLAPPTAASRPDSRPDFIRGFGLDIPEEEEEEEEPVMVEREDFRQHSEAAPQDLGVDHRDGDHDSAQHEGTATASQSRFHSRHVSRLSTALSTRSAGQLDEDELVGEEDVVPFVNVQNAGPEDIDLEDVVGEWTGSEDVYVDGETSEGEESIGEWSNPSDEEHARQQRLDRRNRRRASQQIDQPRRLPNFPRPPENTMVVPMRMDDDIISNPSEEGHQMDVDYLGVDYYSRPPSNLSGSSRPLPPLPHSRVASGQHSMYDPAHAHSRTTSDQFVYPTNQPPAQPSSFAPHRDSLNPFAKPFVFGAASTSWTQDTFSNNAVPPNAPMLGHTRLPSIGKPLNVAAPEFKPTGFTFRPPPGVPPMPPVSANLDVPRPLPEVPSVEHSPFKVQGREKRQRRGSTASLDEGDSMTSFRFPPNPESPQSIRRTPIASASKGHKLNPSAEPFTFAGFSAALGKLPHVPRESDVHAPEPATGRDASAEETLNDESTVKAENGEPMVDEMQLPSVTKLKRAPIPLDFKHPVSNNTVPAGLFKALVNGNEDRTRRVVRSRLSSREIFDFSRRPSMDDNNVAAISQSISRSRSRLVTDPGQRQASPTDDVFGSNAASHFRRRSSFTDAIRPIAPLTHSDDDASNSAGSPMSLTDRLEIQQSERRIEAMLEEGFTALTRELKREANDQHSSTQAMISEIQSLFRTQLRDSAARSLEDSQMDARGEMDFQLFRDIVEEGNRELMHTVQNNLNELQQQLWQARASTNASGDIAPIVEQMGNRTISAVIEAISELSARQEAISRVAPARERDATAEKLMTVLTPVLTSLQSEPIDYEFLTSQLTQAVKPHISQLIDLASDKKETAGLIVDRIVPLLPSTSIDVDAITLQLTAEIRKAIAPIDAFEIKEQVADLVVERLDSRLAVRDKAFNVDNLSGKITEGVTRSLETLKSIPASLGPLAISQESLSLRVEHLSSSQDRLLDVVSGLPSKIGDELQGLKSAQAEMLLKLEEPTLAVSVPDSNVLAVRAAVDDIASSQKALIAQAEELRSLHQTTFETLNTLPDSFQAATRAFQSNQAEFLSSQAISKRELDELRKANMDYQIQLTKARAAHGQVRVEKDMLNEKLGTVEGDRDNLRTQVKELQALNNEKGAQVISLEARNRELEEALAKALARLQASDVATQANQERISEMEKVNREITSERQALKAKVDSLDLQVTFAARDKETALQTLATLQQQHDQLVSQQSHWDDLHRASEKIDMLTTLIGQADNEELKELRRHRDRSKVLEGEHAALQKRFKEQESKVGNSERAALTARQSLAQAQQRSSEWERRAKDYEGQLEMTQTKLDQAEQTQAQLDADYSLVKLQLEEREADDRLAKDQQSKLRDQIATLESKVTLLQSQLEQAKKAPAPTPYRTMTNGSATHPLPRPDSGASTIYDDRSTTPQRRLHSQTSTARSDTPPQASVWDSMHAPTSSDSYKQATTSIHAPRGRYPHLGPGPATPKARRHLQEPQYYRPEIPSPTLSVVSNAPTQGDDGWWS
ncbi:hypothetical protein Hypma_015013 [Hypsizygus marmoreus]|uniref:Uncharacterized protein n=1 Tax=Hypsizygus marmoreus TaxID=39966 RepID=A0A369K9H2_HYPMA|nr:hypothetical protein Hypma_015013 [Hypsizygus marmoreus]